MIAKTYQQALDYLYETLPMFQRVGAVAIKITSTIRSVFAMSSAIHRINFKSIHVAGTNGKGSSAHMLAAILQSAGYKTGLYTSPHLKEFTERIKINGIEIEKSSVLDFVNHLQGLMEEIRPFVLRSHGSDGLSVFR
ncbi:MAG: hypothetical protein WDN75_01255 [Bacteroidota bacterium]